MKQSKLDFGVLSLACLGLLLSAFATAAPTGRKVDLCHATGGPKLNIITVSDNSLLNHLAHGDTLVRDEVCLNGIDDDCNGVVDNDVTDLQTCFSTGVGVCITMELEQCVDNAVVCLAEPGQPTEDPAEVSCSDGLDNDCDGFTDEADADCDVAVTYAIGDTGPGGGLVFYIEPDSGGTAGLEAAPVDQSTGTPWGCYETTTGATGLLVGDGATNTALIVADACSTVGNEAAEVAAAYMGGGFNDWFLPSKDELNEMYLNISQGCFTCVPANPGGFAFEGYWSSSEINSDLAWGQQFFFVGNQFRFGKFVGKRVRAARAF